jgi:acyl-coenzyme A synthetase/AMP-(fatty) acid ligase
VAQETARKIQFPQDRIVCLEPPNVPFHHQCAEFNAKKLASSRTSPRAVITVENLIERGLSDLNITGPKFAERRLQPGEGKSKLAFLSLSSGTTGKPKVTDSLNIPR